MTHHYGPWVKHLRPHLTCTTALHLLTFISPVPLHYTCSCSCHAISHYVTPYHTVLHLHACMSHHVTLRAPVHPHDTAALHCHTLIEPTPSYRMPCQATSSVSKAIISGFSSLDTMLEGAGALAKLEGPSKREASAFSSAEWKEVRRWMALGEPWVARDMQGGGVAYAGVVWAMQGWWAMQEWRGLCSGVSEIYVDC